MSSCVTLQHCCGPCTRSLGLDPQFFSRSPGWWTTVRRAADFKYTSPHEPSNVALIPEAIQTATSHHPKPSSSQLRSQRKWHPDCQPAGQQPSHPPRPLSHPESSSHRTARCCRGQPSVASNTAGRPRRHATSRHDSTRYPRVSRFPPPGPPPP